MVIDQCVEAVQVWIAGTTKSCGEPISASRGNWAQRRLRSLDCRHRGNARTLDTLDSPAQIGGTLPSHLHAHGADHTGPNGRHWSTGLV